MSAGDFIPPFGKHILGISSTSVVEVLVLSANSTTTLEFQLAESKRGILVKHMNSVGLAMRFS